MPPVENWKNQARAPPAGARTLWVGDLEEWMDECVPACPPAPARPAPRPRRTPTAARRPRPAVSAPGARPRSDGGLRVAGRGCGRRLATARRSPTSK